MAGADSESDSELAQFLWHEAQVEVQQEEEALETEEESPLVRNEQRTVVEADFALGSMRLSGCFLRLFCLRELRILYSIYI